MNQNRDLGRVMGVLLACTWVLAGCSADSGAGDDGSFVSRRPTSPVAGSSGGAAGAGSEPPGGWNNPVAGDSGGGFTDPNACGSIDVRAARVTPTVELVVDASGSMNDPFAGCANRWTCLRDALVNEDGGGVVGELEDVVRFGLTLYTGDVDSAWWWDAFVAPWIGGGTMGGAECPALITVDPGLTNHAQIAEAYNAAGPGGSTPTAEALEAVVGKLEDSTNCLDCEVGPQIIVLVTDGDPNGCGEGNDAQQTEAQVQAARDKGISTYVMALADDQDLGHIQRVANLGAGMPADASPGAPFFQPTDAAGLRDALEDILGGAVTCELELQRGEVQGDGASGTVLLNSQPLEYEGENGWRLIDPTHIQLQGTACTEWRTNSSATLNAEFSCDVVLL